ncbi:MAG TPA: response regulator transcription factor [Lacibacter sp.]|nr:response regulator transcription factor [Lacibacter sp.]HMO87710.1 response regulator transcription factor [Lacibacter sp.]HMP86238.1 response regulator transcription factor [Lacibacter sp.]
MNPISVCIVEDVTDIRHALEQIIDLSGSCRLAGSFGDGAEALEEIPKRNPQVVLMDIGLGDYNGIDLVKQLKKQHPSILFMMCTVYEEDEKIFEALRAGASGYILKKSSPAKLIDAIGELVEGGAPMSSQIARKVVMTFQQLPAQPAAVNEPFNDLQQFRLLTNREKEILELLAQGLSVKQIAEQIFIAPDTVRKHLYHIYEKLHVNNRVEAVIKFYGQTK